MSDENLTTNRKQRQGKVVSDKGDKTIVVRVQRRQRHPLYKKVMTKYKKFHTHDPDNTAHVGDQVRIQECRPVSKLKSWELVEVITRQP
jgi:small subunit ribosomal protein S17